MFKIRYKDLYFVAIDITDEPIPAKYYKEDGEFREFRFDFENKTLRKKGSVYSIHLTDNGNEATLFNNWDWNYMFHKLGFSHFRHDAKKIEV